MKEIELVIKVPEKIYQYYKKVWQKRGGSIPESCIAFGTTLPKGHGRLIDADGTILKICGSSCGCHLEECGRDEPCFSVVRIGSAPTIIEADNAGGEE